MEFDKVTKARTKLVMSRPFYGTLALRMTVKEDPTCRTAWTDGRTFGYNPAWANKLTLDEVTAVWAHECLHPAFLHQTRRKWRKPDRWNIAADYAINNILVEDGFKLPDGGCIDPQYNGMGAEEIYTKLPENHEDQFNHSEDPGGCGEVRDAPGTASEKTQHESDWKQALAQAAHAARMQGKMPAGMERFIEGILYTGTPWRDILRRFINDKANDDYSWSRPNRRHIAAGLYLPSAFSERMGPVVIALDTSGSIGEKELQLFGSEFNSLVEDARPSKIHRVFCDAEVARTDEFTPDDDIPWKKLGNIGGGGTDFRPVFDWVEKHGIEPKCLVYLTDMYGSFPETPPPYPVLWASISDVQEAPFGECLRIDEGGPR